MRDSSIDLFNSLFSKMTVITKLSDRDNLIFECIKVILVNKGNINAKQLQWELFQAGIYCRGSILKQALAVMKEKGSKGYIYRTI